MRPVPWGSHGRNLSLALSGSDPIVILPCADAAWIECVLTGAIRGDDRVAILDASGLSQMGPLTRTKKTPDKELSTWLADRITELDGAAPPRLIWLIQPHALSATAADYPDTRLVMAQIGRLADRIRWESLPTRVLITGHDIRLPAALAHLGHVASLDRPSRKDGPEVLDEWVGRVLDAAGWTHTKEDRAHASSVVQGLEAHVAVRVVERAVGASRGLGDVDVSEGSQKLKRELGTERDRLLRDGVLEVREVREDVVESVGGLEHLRAWLDEVAWLYDDPRTQELRPRGVLLAGLPGCGKSLCAEVAAHKLGVPLLQLHMGRLMGRYLGESEGNLQRALDQARASAPCVLWVDEIEKAVGESSQGDGGGTTSRMLGMLLSWMQDNDSGVFVFATANRLEKVPIELLRRGRMDEHFVVRLPTQSEARQILSKSAARIRLEAGVPLGLDEATLQKLTRANGPLFGAKVEPSKGAKVEPSKPDEPSFSGADLDALVREAARDACLRDPAATSIGLANFEYVLESFVPQALQFKDEFVTMEEQIKKYTFREASAKEGVSVVPRRRKTEAPGAAELRALLRGNEDVVLRLNKGTVRFFSSGYVRQAEVKVGSATSIGRVDRLGADVVVTLSGEGARVIQIGWRADGYSVVRGEWEGEKLVREQPVVDSNSVTKGPQVDQGEKLVREQPVANPKPRVHLVQAKAPGNIDIPMMEMGPAAFSMGGDPDDSYANSNETRHNVRLTERFAIALTPVTQDLWFAVALTNPSKFKSGSDAQHCPVEQVSWYDAAMFCNLLSTKAGLECAYRFKRADAFDIEWISKSTGFRLPTEAEWEYAARGGTQFRYAGSNNPDVVAWLNQNGRESTRGVALKKANDYGLYDMSGNVWEWCWDYFDEYPSDATLINPTGPSSGKDRVIRGGSYKSTIPDARVSKRMGKLETATHDSVGFRLCRTLP